MKQWMMGWGVATKLTCLLIVQVLVRYRVSINEKNVRGNTALHLAAAHHHPKIVELLLSVGANPFTENDDRNKPLELVPESDSVSRQLLKSAMANPRPAPLVGCLRFV